MATSCLRRAFCRSRAWLAARRRARAPRSVSAREASFMGRSCRTASQVYQGAATEEPRRLARYRAEELDNLDGRARGRLHQNPVHPVARCEDEFGSDLDPDLR